MIGKLEEDSSAGIIVVEEVVWLVKCHRTSTRHAVCHAVYYRWASE
jgi:hypothetical protein